MQWIKEILRSVKIVAFASEIVVLLFNIFNIINLIFIFILKSMYTVPLGSKLRFCEFDWFSKGQISRARLAW